MAGPDKDGPADSLRTAPASVLQTGFRSFKSSAQAVKRKAHSSERSLKAFVESDDESEAKRARRSVTPPPPCRRDTHGVPEVVGSDGAIMEEYFPRLRFHEGEVIGLSTSSSSSSRRKPTAVPPPKDILLDYMGIASAGHRYFRKLRNSRNLVVSELVDEPEEGPSFREQRYKDSLAKDSSFISLEAFSASSSSALGSRRAAPLASPEARMAELHGRCRQDPTNAENWLDYVALQAPLLRETVGASVLQIREKQAAILEMAIRSQPSDVRLVRTLLYVESCCNSEGTADLKAKRRERLSEAISADTLEDHTWAFLDVATKVKEGPPPILALRTSVLEALSLLAHKKHSAGHDGRLWCAIENAELAAISALALGELRAGYAQRALNLVRCSATLNVFLPGCDPDGLGIAWKEGLRLGEKGLLTEAQLLVKDTKDSLPPPLVAVAHFAEGLQETDPEPKLEAAADSQTPPLEAWVRRELHQAKVVGEDSSQDFDEIRPFLVAFRTEPARRECLYRFLDFLGSSTLSRHSRSSRYRSAFLESFAACQRVLVSKGSDARVRVTSEGAEGLVTRVPAKRSALLVRSILQGLRAFPREFALQEALLHSLWQTGSVPLKVSKKVLQVSEDPRLFFAFARGMWLRGDQKAARAVLLKLCQNSKGDARIALGWWLLETFQGAGSPCKNIVTAASVRVLHSLASGNFGDELLSEAAPQERRLESLKAISKLQKLLSGQNGNDAGHCRLLLPSYHSTLVALCVVQASTQPGKALSVLKKEFDCHSRPYHAASGRTLASFLLQGDSAAIEQSRAWEAVCGLVGVTMMGTPAAPRRFALEALRMGLQVNPQSPSVLQSLAAVHISAGSLSQLRRDLDRALAFRDEHSLWRVGCEAGALQAALAAEIAFGERCDFGRLLRLCELAAEANSCTSSFRGSAAWSLGDAVLRESGASPQARWRWAVRAVASQPLEKSLRLLQLATCEALAAKAYSEEAAQENEELILDLVAQMETAQFNLTSDPLEAIA